MYETDADRLAMIRVLGGVAVSAPGGELYALFDLDHVSIGEVPVDSVQPRLTARSSDIERCQVRQGATVTIDGTAYVAQSVQQDGLGMTNVILEGP